MILKNALAFVPAAGFVIMALVGISMDASAGPPDAPEQPARQVSSLAQGWFVGLNSGQTVFRLPKSFVANAVVNNFASETHIALEAGKEIGRSRITASYYFFFNDPEINLKRFKIAFETPLSDWALTPYAGISTGYASYEELGLAAKNPAFVITKDNVTAKNNIKIAGPTYGLTLGLAYHTSSVDFRLSYEYSKLVANDTVFFDGVAERLQVNSIQAASLSLAYRF